MKTRWSNTHSVVLLVSVCEHRAAGTTHRHPVRTGVKRHVCSCNDNLRPGRPGAIGSNTKSEQLMKTQVCVCLSIQLNLYYTLVSCCIALVMTFWAKRNNWVGVGPLGTLWPWTALFVQNDQIFHSTLLKMRSFTIGLNNEKNQRFPSVWTETWLMHRFDSKHFPNLY